MKALPTEPYTVIEAEWKTGPQRFSTLLRQPGGDWTEVGSDWIFSDDALGRDLAGWKPLAVPAQSDDTLAAHYRDGFKAGGRAAMAKIWDKWDGSQFVRDQIVKEFDATETDAGWSFSRAIQSAYETGYEVGVKRSDGYNEGFIAGVVEAQARIAEGLESAREADLDDGYDWQANQ